MRAVIRIGHHGPWTGAQIRPWLDEVAIATDYARVAQGVIRAAGHECDIIESGPSRYHLDDLGRCDLYVQAHVNSAPEIKYNHSLVFCDYRSKMGPLAALEISEQLHRATGYLTYTDVAGPQSRYSRVYPCISGIKPVAILLEPGFIQLFKPEHIKNWGEGLGRGVLAFFQAHRA